MGRLEQIGKIRGQLLKKRDEVFEALRLSDEARLILSEQDTEPEETAQKEAIQAINRAMTRMELGEYGICEVCGKEIEVERLEAIPWTSVCGKHMRETTI
jgi:DnaK suppressor protein